MSRHKVSEGDEGVVFLESDNKNIYGAKIISTENENYVIHLRHPNSVYKATRISQSDEDGWTVNLLRTDRVVNAELGYADWWSPENNKIYLFARNKVSQTTLHTRGSINGVKELETKPEYTITILGEKFRMSRKNNGRFGFKEVDNDNIEASIRTKGMYLPRLTDYRTEFLVLQATEEDVSDYEVE